MLANLALALLSAALTAALFLLVLLLVEGWRRSPAVAAVAVTAVPAAALAAGPLFRGLRAGTRSEAVAGSVLIAGGLTGLALLPGAKLAWTIAPQVLVGLGLGLSIDSLTAAALRDRIPRALHGGWTIAARHAGVVVGLAILTPIFTADLRHAETPAKEAVASLVLDSPLPASTKLDLADGLGRQLVAERGRVPDLRPAFKSAAAAGGAGGHRREPGGRPRGSARARRDPRVPHRLPRRGGAGAAGAGARSGPERPEPTHEGARACRSSPCCSWRPCSASRSPRAAATTCRAGRPIRASRAPVPPIPPQLEPVAERIVLLGLDSAACRLGVSRERLVLALADPRSLDPRAPAALKAGLRDAVDRLDREGRLPKVSQLLPEALDQADLPGIVKTLIGAIPAGTVDSALPTGPLLRRAVDELDVDAARPSARRPEPARVGRPVGDPPGRARPDPGPPAPLVRRSAPHAPARTTPTTSETPTRIPRVCWRVQSLIARDDVARRARLDDADGQRADRQREPDDVVDEDLDNLAGRARMVGGDDVQGDEVEEPGHVGQRAGQGGGLDREAAFEPRAPSGSGASGASLARRSADAACSARATANPRMITPPAISAMPFVLSLPWLTLTPWNAPDHQQPEGDREGQPGDDVGDHQPPRVRRADSSA